MKTMSLLKQAAVASSIVVLSIVPTFALGADKPKSEAVGSRTATVASGAVEDTLKACLARIPTDASAGQRMMAELSCQRDEQLRTPFQVTPSR